MIIAVDFDGTIVEHKYPKIGNEIPFAVETLIKLQKEHHHRLILWTFRIGKELDEAVEFCKSKGLIFYSHNAAYPGEIIDSKTPRKLYADVYIDDKNVGGLPDWGFIYQQITNPDCIEIYSRLENKKIQKNIFIRFGEWLERVK